MTPEQKTAIAAKLGADLTAIASDRLIELALLHRAAPTAQPDFPTRLQAEITRRFTADAIAQDDVTYSTLQHLADTLTGVIPLAQRLLHEMAASINRDIWFTDNAAAFKDVLNNADSAKWLAGQTDVLEKCLHNRLALAMLAESTPAATAILSEPTAVALWKNTPDLWDIWPQHAAGMTVIAKSAELTQYIIDTPAALAAVIASDNAMQPLIASPTARHVWVDSAVAMAAVAGSQVAMAAVAASSTALAEIVQTATGRAALIAHNDNLQAVRQQIYDTIKTGWKRKVNVYAGASGAVGTTIPGLTNPIKTPENALVFACMGFLSGWTAGKLELQHPGGSVAMLGTNTRPQPNSMLSVDGITFGGAAVINRVAHGYGYFELWTKE